jgi:beta-N-acetylhexosaminidase
MRRGRLLLGIMAGIVTVATAIPAASAPELQLPRMSLREKVGQLVMFGVAGRSLTSEERDVIERQHFGAVILFDQNYSDRAQLERLTAQIQTAARRGSTLRAGALIAVDQEGGVVKRFEDMPPRYSAPEMGRIGKSSVAYDQGRATGGALRRSGVNVDLAPVADLDLPPEHVMRSRSFGRNENKVARLSRAFGRGLQSRRVAAASKHFPGFGGASVNSDFGRAYIRRSKWQLHHVDSVPFHAAVDGGIRMIMLSHGMYLNDGGRVPASVSRYIATRRLRDEFGFTGVAISDALEPVAWRYDGDVARACKATIWAGVDVALITGNVHRARACARSIRNAVGSGGISERRIDEAVTRVLQLKAWLGLYDAP